MKRFIVVCSVLIMLFSAVGVNAEEFTFDIYKDTLTSDRDEAVLMETGERDKAAFKKKIINAWENMETTIQLYPEIKVDKDDIADLYFTLCLENPKYYYVVRSFARTNTLNGYVNKLVNISYTEKSMDAVRETWEKIDAATEEILFYISPEMTDFEKIVTVHDYMELHYEYNIEDTDQTMLIMLDKRGVCAAYAEAFQHMMNVLGIESTLVTSNEMAHVWNMVKTDGEWYHADITWDDPVPDQFGRVRHEYMLLSEDAIRKMGHTGFDAPYDADSTLYDDADWRDDNGSIVTVKGVMYRIEGNNLIDENDRVLYEGLDGGDGKWSIGGGYVFKGGVYAGLCQINGILYFNTDTGIFSCNPESEEVTEVLEKTGICGVFADGNVLVYNKFDTGASTFVKSGEVKIADAAIAEPYYENGSAVVKIYNACGEPVRIISKGNGYLVHEVKEDTLGTARFENGEEQTIYIWKDNLEPVAEPFTTSE